MATVRHLGLFPWCVPTVDQNAPYSAHPAAVDLETAMKWFWRVKSWRFVGTATLNDKTVTQNQIILNNAVYEEGDYSVPQPQSESGIVCVRGTRGVYNDFEVDGFGFYLFGEAISQNPAIYYQGQLYPQIAAFIRVDDIGFGTITTTEGAVSAGTMSIDGISLSLTLGETSPAPPGSSASITVTAEEYWPYDPGDGLGPIYDSTTGDKLREFPE